MTLDNRIQAMPVADREVLELNIPVPGAREPHTRCTIQSRGQMERLYHRKRLRIPTGNSTGCRLRHIEHRYARGPFHLPGGSGLRMSRERYECGRKG